MTYSVVISANAEDDISASVEYIAEENPGRARTFTAELRERFQSKLSTLPHSGVTVGPFRYSTFANYIVVYQVDADAEVVTVVMVMEGHRGWRQILDV